MMTVAEDMGVALRADPERVVARLFRPGESTPGGVSRTESVVSRVLAVPAQTLALSAQRILATFGSRHHRLVAILRDHAALVRGADASAIEDDVAVVLGAAFTAEYAVEGAALCNPSAVDHPDQSGLVDGQRRVLLSVRSIGESHLSSIQFCEAIVGPGRAWTFSPRETPLRLAAVTPGQWGRDHLLRTLERDGQVGELVRSVGQALPETFASSSVEEVLQGLRLPLIHPVEARAQLDQIRVTASSAYRATFPEDSSVSARVLLPVAEEERQGMEDARFVRVEDEGGPLYRGTYTAYDGQSISSRLITTPDFRTFEVQRMTGAPSHTKGMALFPRRVGGQMLALSRGDGESISLTRSANGLDWGAEEAVYQPSAWWEVVQSGNCGPPMETTEGWLVLTHGVGPMRVYSVGAILLDLEDPARVRGVLREPLLQPEGDDRDGYVPSVVYSCGGVIHDGVVWIPHGVGDDRIRVASIPLVELLAAMTWPDEPEPGSEQK